MRDHSQKMECTRVFRVGIAGKAVEAFSFNQTTGTMMRYRGCERLFGTASGTHHDISKMIVRSVAGSIASETQIHLTRASIDPDRLIAGQRARRAIYRVTCNV